MERETTGWPWRSGLGLATKCMSKVTSVHLKSFYLTKLFLPLQVCFLMSLEAVDFWDHMTMGQMSQEGSLITIA